MKIKILIPAVAATALLVWYLFSLPRELFVSPSSAVLETRDGKLLGARIASDGQWRFPQCDSVPDKFAKAIITYEDKRFRNHIGIDFLATGNALKSNIKAGRIKRGASTITMQTIRLSREGKPRTIWEKIIEAILATRLELRCTKDEILALYSSNAPFGGNVVGLQAAAWRYFERSPDELSWAESAMLAILPNSPALIHLGKNRDRLLSKRNFLLDKMASANIIDSIECLLAKEEPLPQRPYPMPRIATHYLETLRKAGGDKIYRTNIDLQLQSQVESIILNHNRLFRSNKVNNMAAIVLDVTTGNVVAYCGNVPYGNSNKKTIVTDALDVDVVQAPRSSGSTLKPFLYAAMLDEGSILPTMLISDIPFHYKNFSPRNFNNTFDGAVPADKVIQRSLNVPSVRMLNEYGIEKALKLLHQLGFTTLTRGADIYGLSLILGGAEISLFDLAKAYCTLACQLRACNDNPSQDFPISSAALWSTFEALSEINRPEEEGEWRTFSSSRKVAWKTGTSYGNRDAWSVGITKDYVVAVWVGNCSGEGRPNLTGVGYAAPVMFDILSRLPTSEWFEMPFEGWDEIVICKESGHPLSERCTANHIENNFSPIDTILVPSAPIHPEPCPYHKVVHLSSDMSYIVNSDCYDVSKMKTVSWFVLPPAQEWYYMRSHSDYRRLPPYHPSLLSNSTSRNYNRIMITYPQNGMKVAAPIALDSKSRGVILSAVHSDPDATIFWHLDDSYIGSTSGNEHKISIIPTRGRHTLTIVDQNGAKNSVYFLGE